MDDRWIPWAAFPADVVRPLRVDPAGQQGPTRGQAAGPRWRTTSRGLVVPAGTPISAEQRIVEVAASLPSGALVTGWAALRLWGGGFFDGLDARMRPVPVPVVVAHDRRLRSGADRRVFRDREPPEGVLRQGVACVRPERAVLDAMRLAAGEREAVVALDMVLAAGLTTADRVAAVWADQPRRVGAGLVRFGLRHGRPGSRSPGETRLRLLWTLDAGMPDPLVNPEVRRLEGGFVGVPDLLDARTGLVGEYDGALHRERDRHRRDNARRERFVEAGLEPVTVVAGEQRADVVRRLRAAQARAEARLTAPRQWFVASGERSAGRWVPGPAQASPETGPPPGASATRR